MQHGPVSAREGIFSLPTQDKMLNTAQKTVEKCLEKHEKCPDLSSGNTVEMCEMYTMCKMNNAHCRRPYDAIGTSVGVLLQTFWHFRNNKTLLQKERNCQLKASGLEQMAELRKICYFFVSIWNGDQTDQQFSVTDGLCPGEPQPGGGGDGWCGVWVGCGWLMFISVTCAGLC